MAQVVWITKSSASKGGGLRFSSVKYMKEPPPIALPGKASRAAE
jgi:hypothetical protein